MKAAIRQQYGLPDVLNVLEVDKPVPKDNEVLVKVYAATVNRTDCGILTGKPFIIKLFTGFPNPTLSVTGSDFAGVVEAIGTKVTQFKAGDRIFGFSDNGLSSHAEYLTIDADKPLAIIPDNISFEQAAASIEGAHYAINFINKVKLWPGSKVMVNGATGAIGSAALQILISKGLYVAATCRGIHMDLIKSLGAGKVIDYEKEDFTKDEDQYDFVFDSVGKSTFGACKPLLKEGGIYISSELGPGGQNIFYALYTPFFGDKKVVFPFPYDTKASLAFVRNLLEKGAFKPVIDRHYPLEQIREAFEYAFSGNKVGNIILKMNED